jgi:hypothetical protein
MAPVRSHDDKQVETHVAITAPARVSWRPPWTPPVPHDAFHTAGAAQHLQQGRVRLVARFSQSEGFEILLGL